MIFPLQDSRSDRLFSAMYRLRRAWQEYNSPPSSLCKSELNTLLCIQHLKAGETATVSSLARAMHQTPAAISQRISALENAGYVRRTRAGTDRRVYTVCITPSGQAVLQQNWDAVRHRSDVILAKLGAEKSDTLIDLINTLCGVMEAPPAAQQAQTKETTP